VTVIAGRLEEYDCRTSRGTQPPDWDKERKSRGVGRFPDGHIGIMVDDRVEEKCQNS
jgi:hypothetical protein